MPDNESYIFHVKNVSFFLFSFFVLQISGLLSNLLSVADIYYEHCQIIKDSSASRWAGELSSCSYVQDGASLCL